MAATVVRADHTAIEMEQLLTTECCVCNEERPSDGFVGCRPTGKNCLFTRRTINQLTNKSPALEGSSSSHTFCTSCVAHHADATLQDFTMLAPDASGLRCMNADCLHSILLGKFAFGGPNERVHNLLLLLK